MLGLQYGRNNSASWIGNSFMVIPNNLSSNLSVMSNCILVMDALGIIERIDCGTDATGADMFVQDDIQLGGKLFAGDGIRSEGDADFFMRGNDFEIFNGTFHQRTPQVIEVGVGEGEVATPLNENFNDGTLDPFVQKSSGGGSAEWTTVSDLLCNEDECARAQGGGGSPQRIMEANFTTSI